MNRNKFILNSVLNIFSTVVPLLVLQIILLPLISRKISEHEYGAALTIISLLNIIPGVIAIALNNVRLIKNDIVEDKNIFSNILLQMIFLNLILTLITTVYFEKNIGLSTIFTLILSMLWLFREYFLVEFQIILNYNKILLNNFILSVGFFIGYGLFTYFNIWQIVYIVGYLFSLIHIIFSNNVKLEFADNKSQINNIRTEMLMLAGATLLIRVTSYADRLILFPLMGGKIVAIYYAATILAKVISMGINPISSVMLAYLSRMENYSKKSLNLFIGLSGFICFIGYFIVVLISKYLLIYLYPQFYNQAMELIPFTTGATLLYVFISVLNPLILRIFPMKWQVIINGSNALLYIVLTLFGLKYFGLVGFCIAIMIANLLKICQMLFLFFKGEYNALIINR